MQNAETKADNGPHTNVSSSCILHSAFSPLIRSRPLNPVQYILVGLVKLYQWTLSPAKIYFFGPNARCRFTPSCSAYACEAVKTHGVIRGGWLALKRLGRCHPWGDWGPDPVPPPAAKIHCDCRRTEFRPATDSEIAGAPARCR
jgi:putative membrane protein insertion efficiency factor